jgi:DNA-binding MarR family transcriptional regulator
MSVSVTTGSRLALEMADSCLMMRSRLVSRVLTGMYDDALRPHGIQASQLNLLVFVARTGPIRRGELGTLMHIDPSTLTRNLRVMLANGWIEEAKDGADGRGHPVRISRKGENLVAKVAPDWKNAQRRAAALLGERGEATLVGLGHRLIGRSA